jgi:predicted metalloprotease with PDZ domain
MSKSIYLLFLSLCIAASTKATTDTIKIKIGTALADSNRFQVRMVIPVQPAAIVDLRMPVWTPGYYQLMPYAKGVENIEVTDVSGKPLAWQKNGADCWRIATRQAKEILVTYLYKTERSFVATSYIDEKRAFIRPTGLFLYAEGSLQNPVQLQIELTHGWDRIATGLDSIAPQQFRARDMDQVYDSPILIGKLSELPPFKIEGKAHRFIGYEMGNFDGARLMQQLEKIIQATGQLMGEYPYNQYTFIGIGAGNGGIEQLNSTAISFTGDEWAKGGKRTISFLTHEYFHHYNVKRIRPIELGPFDYSRANRTNSLWVSEGLTVYYESLLLHRAGILSQQEVLQQWQGMIERYENNPGRFKQTLAASSYETWEDGPFGKKGETISFYEKGPIIGLLLDMEIRSSTNNKKSLDDLMRHLYYTYYKAGRGFTDAELKADCERIAGKGLEELFSYIYTTNSIDYSKYLSKAGLSFQLIQEQAKPVTRVNISEHQAATPSEKAVFKAFFR